MTVDTLSLIILPRCRQSVVFHTERDQRLRHSQETVVINGDHITITKGLSANEMKDTKYPDRFFREQQTSCKRVISNTTELSLFMFS